MTFENFRHLGGLRNLRYIALFVACAAPQSHASEGFRLRYNLIGSLGGEIFVVEDKQGPAAGAALTSIHIDKITGNDGKAGVALTAPGGTVNLGSSVPTSLHPTYDANTVELNGSGTQAMVDLGVGYVTEKTFGGGRVTFAASLPYSIKRSSTTVTGNTPALSWPNNSIPGAGTKAAVATSFDTNYQGQLASAGAATTGEVETIGDLSLFGGWIYSTERVRVVTGASLVIPTGTYDKHNPTNISTGDFMTLRPAIQVGWRPTEELAVGGKITVGINTRNKQTDVKSGNWVGLEAALGYMTPFGPAGLQAAYVHQFQDDGGSGNTYGPNRLRSMNLGFFATTKISAINAYVTLHCMETVKSYNAQAGRFYQIRLVKPF